MRAAACLLPLLLAACSGSDGQEQKREAPQVGYVTVTPADIPLTTSLGGRTVAFETSEVRPQVGGLILKRNFTEGSFVHAGQTLFQIDPSLYRATANQAAANLASAQAAADAAAARADRYRPLAQIEAIAQQDYTDAQATARQARAAVAQNAAALETARINLRFTTVPAPISGRIGRSLATVGALASASQTNPLAVIQRIDPIYVDMQQSSADMVALRSALASGQAGSGSALVRLKMEDGSDYPLTGTMQFADVTVNEATGTVTLRARFPNPEGLLLPGMFVKGVFEQAVARGAYRVPQQGLQRDFGGKAFVLLAGRDNKVERRAVTAERTIGTDWVIASGLKPGDRVIVQGTANLKAGMPVRPVPASTPQKVGQKPAATPQEAG